MTSGAILSAVVTLRMQTTTIGAYALPDLTLTVTLLLAGFSRAVAFVHAQQAYASQLVGTRVAHASHAAAGSPSSEESVDHSTRRPAEGKPNA